MKLSFQEYLKHPALGRSQLAHLLKNPGEYRLRQTKPIKDTDAMRFGRLAHCMLLEPDEVKNRYVISPKFDKRKTKDKADLAEFSKIYAGYELVTADEMARAERVVNEIYGTKSAMAILDSPGCLREESVFFNYNGRECKCRPDLWPRPAAVVADLKTCDSAEDEAFERHAFKMYYDFQAAWYMTGTYARDWFYIAAESDEPHGVRVILANKDHLESGRDKMKRVFDELERCEKSNNWRAYPDEITEIGIPRWARRNGNE